jgi:hypothetical protein
LTDAQNAEGVPGGVHHGKLDRSPPVEVSGSGLKEQLCREAMGTVPLHDPEIILPKAARDQGRVNLPVRSPQEVFGPKRTAPQGIAIIDRDQSPGLVLGEETEVGDVLEEAPERLAVFGLGKECGLPSPRVGYGKGQSVHGTIDHGKAVRGKGARAVNSSEKQAGKNRKR